MFSMFYYPHTIYYTYGQPRPSAQVAANIAWASKLARVFARCWWTRVLELPEQLAYASFHVSCLLAVGQAYRAGIYNIRLSYSLVTTSTIPTATKGKEIVRHGPSAPRVATLWDRPREWSNCS
jgi:hypothetical protein